MIGVLLENKKKTYAQYRMIEDIFYDCLCDMDIFEKEDFEKNALNEKLKPNWKYV